MSTPPPPPKPPIRPPSPPTPRKPEAVQPVLEARAEAIFNGAVALPESAREEFLAVECRGDEALLARVKVLLAAHSDVSEFLDEPQMPTEIEAELARLKPEEAGDRIGPYKLLQEIGVGGFGTVWMADQEHPVRRRVALKIIKLGMDTKEVIARFEQERQALAMMDHPNIAKVFDAGATQWGRPFFVMELVKGIPITEFCDARGLGTRARLALFTDVCSAINHAHQKGVIHRDIKPSNVMVTLHGDRPVVKVIDFGIAKATQDRLTDKTLFTRFEQFIGTPVYMSPEQAALSGLDIDTRSDIYALGILLYELLTGKPPFDAQTLASAGYDEMRRIIREVEPPRPSMRLSTVAGEERTTIAKARHTEPEKLSCLVEPDLDWIVMKAIDKDRARRYETANGLALDIERFLADEPVNARPPTTGYKFRKFTRRNKAAFRVAAGIAVVLVGATAVSTWQAVRATRAEKLAGQRLADSEKARKDAEEIATFLGDIFQNPDPTQAARTVTTPDMLNRDADPIQEVRVVTAADMLNAAAKKLETELAAQPGQRAKLQATLGRTCFGLGLYPQAIALQEKVREYYLTTFGPEHPDTLKALGELPQLYYRAGREKEAVQLRTQMLPLLREKLGPEHPETLKALFDLGSFLVGSIRNDEAVQMCEEALAGQRKVLGLEHRDTVNSMSLLAAARFSEGRREEALKLREEVVQLRRRLLGPLNPETLRAMRILAMSYEGDREQDALKLREETLAALRKTVGAEHPDTIVTMADVARSYRKIGRVDEALALNGEALELARKILGSEHPTTLWIVLSRALIYETAGRADEALKLNEEALALCRKALGPVHLYTQRAESRVAQSYRKLGRRQEVVKMFEESLAQVRAVAGPKSMEAIYFLVRLAGEYQITGGSKEALALFSEAAALSPGDPVPAMGLALLQAWLGLDADHATTVRRFIEHFSEFTDSRNAGMAAYLVCVHPISDAPTRDSALAFARKAAEATGESTTTQILLSRGLTGYRTGNYAEACATFTTVMQRNADIIQERPRRSIPSIPFYRAMSLFQLGKTAEAREAFAAAEAQKELQPTQEGITPINEGDPLGSLMTQIAQREAKALLAGAPSTGK